MTGQGMRRQGRYGGSYWLRIGTAKPTLTAQDEPGIMFIDLSTDPPEVWMSKRDSFNATGAPYFAKVLPTQEIMLAIQAAQASADQANARTLAPGPQGPQGSVGAPGQPGAAGAKGDTGATGPAGPGQIRTATYTHPIALAAAVGVQLTIPFSAPFPGNATDYYLAPVVNLAPSIATITNAEKLASGVRITMTVLLGGKPSFSILAAKEA